MSLCGAAVGTVDSAPAQAVTDGGLRWTVAAAYQDVLFGPAGFRLPEWLARGQASVVKKGPHRVVYRVDLPEARFYVKHNLLPDLRAWLRQLFRPSKARMEYARAVQVARRGVPTVEPLAFGEAAGGWCSGESYLITHSLEPTVQLDGFLEVGLPSLPGRNRTVLRQRLAVALGGFIARLHDAGVLHNDLHCGNILLRLDEEERPELYLVDLQSVRLGAPLNWRRSMANLVMLNRWLALRASRADRLRFWRAYLAGRARGLEQDELGRALARGDECPEEFRACAGELGRAVEAATCRSNEQFWRRRDRRWFERNRHNRRLRRPGLRGYAVTGLGQDDLDRLLADPDAPFAEPGVRLLKNSRSVQVAEFVAEVDGRCRPVIYKRFAVTDVTDPFTALVRLSPPLRSWVNGHGLRERALPTARPLAVLHRYRWGLPREGYLLMEKVPSLGDLHEGLTRLDGRPLRPRQAHLRRAVEDLARLLREMHRRHLTHRDTKAANLLVRTLGMESAGGNAGPGDHFSFWFIDLVGVNRRRAPGREVRVKNLARLHASFWADPRVSRTDKLRFLRVYLQWGLLGREGWKGWWRSIERATLAKVRKNLRNGRPLA